MAFPEASPASPPISLRLVITPARLSVCRLDPGQSIPSWGTAGAWWSVSRSDAELTIVCDEFLVPEGVIRSGPWRAVMVEGPLGHSLVGILASVANPLVAARVPIFAVSSYDTDWLLLPEEQLAHARSALREAGHHVEP